MISISSFRSRIFLVLAFVALIPAALTLATGTLVLREVVLSTGSAGAWDQVAQSGRTVLDEIESQNDPSPELVSAAEVHRTQLAESVRLSRLYAFLGDRVLVLLPALAFVLLILVAGLSLFAANWFSRSFSRPVDELIGWTRAIGSGEELPPPEVGIQRHEMREFRTLRNALRETATELKIARKREIERVRLESWSEMARRVAHEIKNPLTPMRMAANRIVAADDPGLAEAGEVLRDEIARLDELARTFSHFGRPPEGPMSAIDLKELLTSITRRLSTESTPVTLDAPDTSGSVEVIGHLDALERVVRNLVANAQEAMTASNVDAPVEIILRPLQTAAEIRILDRGPGIPDEVLPRIWEPEFTTKRRGTGLGLPMVRQAIQAHGGEIWAFNREGGGAEFRVRIPYSPPESAPERELGTDANYAGETPAATDTE